MIAPLRQRFALPPPLKGEDHLLPRAPHFAAHQIAQLAAPISPSSITKA